MPHICVLSTLLSHNGPQSILGSIFIFVRGKPKQSNWMFQTGFGFSFFNNVSLDVIENQAEVYK